MCAMRVQLIDPSGDVAPYDHALAAALAAPRGRGGARHLALRARAGGRRRDGYAVDPMFYRLATRLGRGRPAARRALKLAEHVPDMLRLRAGRRAPTSPLPVAARSARSTPGCFPRPGRAC